jgi:hypothetical protein
MDYRIETDRKQQVLCVTIGGIVTQKEFDDLYDQVAKACAVDAPKLAIVDFTTVTFSGVSAEHAISVAWSTPAIPLPAVRVIVAPQPHIYGMARMVGSYRQEMDGKFHVVRTMEECYPLLGVKKLEFSSWNHGRPQ